MIKKLLKDMHTDPSGKTYSWLFVTGTIIIIAVLAVAFIDVWEDHQLDIKSILEGFGLFIGGLYGVYTAQYGINKFNKKMSKKNDNDIT